jgi:RNA polymerase sigma factor (sigma-70 family)
MKSNTAENIKDSMGEIRSKFRNLVLSLCHKNYKRIQATGSNLDKEDFIADIEADVWTAVLKKYLNTDGTYSDDIVNKKLIGQITRNSIFDVIKEKNDHREQTDTPIDYSKETTGVNKFDSYEKLSESNSAEHLEFGKEDFTLLAESLKTLDILDAKTDDTDRLIMSKLKLGMTYEETADELGISKKTVQRKMRAIKNRISAALNINDVNDSILEELLD